MTQEDYSVSNASGATVRADINAQLGAIATMNSGASEPTTKFSNMAWFDEANNLAKVRDEANANWITIAEKTATDWNPYFGTAKMDTIFAKLAGPAFTGDVSMAGELQLDGVVQTPADVFTSTSNAVALVMTGGSKKTLTLDETTTITVSAEVADQVVELWIKQGSTGGTAAWSGVDQWIGGSAPTLSTTTGERDIIILASESDGSTIVAQHLGVAS